MQSIRTKFDNLQEFMNKAICGKNADVLDVAETITDSGFPSSQFLTEGFYNSYRLDILCKSDGLFLHVKATMS